MHSGTYFCCHYEVLRNNDHSFLRRTRGFSSALCSLVSVLKERRKHNSSTCGHLISERRWNVTFDYTEIVNKPKLRWGACQIMRFIFPLPKVLHIYIWKYFHGQVTCSISRDYYEKNKMLNFLGVIFLNSLA